MTLWALAILLVALMAARVAFLAFHLRDLDGLWRDYARGGLTFQVARGIDFLTLALFAAAAVWSLWGINAQTPNRLGRVFVAWLGFLLLERLLVHRFPRTNAPGGLSEAQVALLVNVLLSVLGAVAATVVAAVYFWWRK